MDYIINIVEDLQAGNAEGVKTNVEQALESGMSADEVLQQGMMKAMAVVGEKFKKDEIFVPEVLVAARAMKRGMKVLKPVLVDDKVESQGTVLLGTVKGDLHDIGKNLVGMMLEGGGFEVIDMGVDVEAAEFVAKLKEEQADVLAMSALLTTTMPEMKNVIDVLKEEGLRDKVKVIIGGAPVTCDYADQIEADAYAKDAASAVDKVKEAVTSLK